MPKKFPDKLKSFLGSFFGVKGRSASSFKASAELSESVEKKSIEEIREKTEDISEKVSDFSEENEKLSKQLLHDAKINKILLFITFVSMVANIILILQLI